LPAGQIDSVVNPPSCADRGVPAQVVSATLTPGNAGLLSDHDTSSGWLNDGDQPVTIQVNSIQAPTGVLITVQISDLAG